ncbi:hypothetical protein CEE37_12995 [candidate division LCP-89 bacterium B3_LCP]|uniref:Secretion system C-terminal sorting domain-containing protein n=1 Tax=candidate division LCP-89 bacterium B3_LCP TaxID=2012998 RepID=A0A532UU13_UNCL8|nr:MAG: hypothetical protein CEE37_12995 [candidate division LCP-89 bacterium B3_LCP]
MRTKILILLASFLLLTLTCRAQGQLYSNYWFAYSTVEVDRPIAADSSIYQSSCSAIPFGEDRMIHFYSEEDFGDCYQIYNIYGEEVFSTPQLLLPALDPDYMGIPHVVLDGIGGLFAVVRISNLQDEGLYAQRLDSEGNRLWGDAGILLSEEEFHSTLEASPDGVGGFLYTFRHADSNDIIVQRVDSTGQKEWGDNGVIVCDNLYQQDIPAITHDECGGAYVIWRDYRPPHVFPSGRAYIQKVDFVGNTIWATNGVQFSSINRQPWFFQLIPDGEEGFVLHEGSGVYNFAHRVDPNGHLLWERDYVSWGDEAQIAEGDSGFFYTAWCSEFADSIYAQNIDMDGNFHWGDFPGVLMATGNNIYSNLVDVYYNNSHLFGAFYFGESSPSWDLHILAQCLDSNGQYLWGPEGTMVSSNAEGGCFNISIVSDQINGATTFFDVHFNGEHNVFAKHINANGSLGGPKPVRVIPPIRTQISGISEGLVRYNISKPGIVNIDLYNLLGQHIKTIQNNYQQPGTHTTHIDQSSLSSGIYFLRLHTPTGSNVSKMVVMR